MPRAIKAECNWTSPGVEGHFLKIPAVHCNSFQLWQPLKLCWKENYSHFLKLFSIFLKILSFSTLGNTVVLRTWYPLQTVRRCLCVPEYLKGVAMELRDWMKHWLQARFDPDITAVVRLVEACSGFVQLFIPLKSLPTAQAANSSTRSCSFLPCLSLAGALLWAGCQPCWATGRAMLYQQVKKAVGDCCVSLTYIQVTILFRGGRGKIEFKYNAESPFYAGCLLATSQ